MTRPITLTSTVKKSLEVNGGTVYPGKVVNRVFSKAKPLHVDFTWLKFVTYLTSPLPRTKVLAKRVYIWFNSHWRASKVKSKPIPYHWLCSQQQIQLLVPWYRLNELIIFKLRHKIEEVLTKKTMNTVLSLCSKFTSFELPACSPGEGVLPWILDRGVQRRFVNPNPI